MVYEGMDLPLDIIRTRGRAVKPLEARVVRQMTPADLMLLGEEKGSTAPPIKRLRDRHHALARNLASGMKPGDAAIICGYDPSRVSILLGDPTFRNLVDHYRESVDAQYVQLHETLSGMSLDAALILRERMEDDPDKIKVDQLIDVIKTGADRTGYGPSTKQDVNINVNLADRLQEARKRVASRQLELTRNAE